MTLRQDRDQQQTLVDLVTNLWVQKNFVNILILQVTADFSRKDSLG